MPTPEKRRLQSTTSEWDLSPTNPMVAGFPARSVVLHFILLVHRNAGAVDQLRSTGCRALSVACSFQKVPLSACDVGNSDADG